MSFKLNLDALGIASSLACAIHCALLPLLLTSLPLFGTNLLHNFYLETFMVIIAFCIGIYSLYHGWKKHHHSLWPIIIFSIGFTFLVLKMFFIHYEYWLLVPAVLGIVIGHVSNYRSCRAHNHAHADDCNHEDLVGH